VSTEVKLKIDELKSKLEKESLYKYNKLNSDSYLQCENILKDEAAKFEEIHKKFIKDKDDHLQGLKGIISIAFWFCHLLLLKDFTESDDNVFLLYRHCFIV
ncbi:hypothetical protein CARUB_v10019290mg, partial [Capsella rubella]